MAEWPDLVQLEFRGAQLLFSNPTIEKAPSTMVALQFRNPTSVSFLSDKNMPVEEVNLWPQKLQRDETDGFTCSYGFFTFIDDVLIQEIVRELSTVQTVFGEKPFSPDFNKSPVRMCFRAGGVGMLIGAESLRILSHEGEVLLSEVEEKNRQWWSYWKQYWQVKDTADAYPVDYACEVTIPLQE
ncbi:hypothetical protein [Hymenobacter rigui]|uniref:Uncharacterized protein n=1 Tax=Hymenobacter rigui TaxID=334424 RepID=A0A3R9PXJ4_9BACT|nr:hypothetical protein [Hymenobacter rigui]RSK48368.1 hypothetical protein EI291_11645 [Hymenobacter rigui]